MQFHQAKAKPAYNYRYTQALSTMELLPRFELGTSSLPKEQNEHFRTKAGQKYKKSAHNPTFAASKKLQRCQ